MITAVPGALTGVALKQVTILALFLTSPSLNGRTIEMDLSSEASLAAVAKNTVNIKEGVEYKYVQFGVTTKPTRVLAECFDLCAISVGMRFRVNHDIISGLRYIHVVKRSGLKGQLFGFTRAMHIPIH